jgi:hypothetical protein
MIMEEVINSIWGQWTKSGWFKLTKHSWNNVKSLILLEQKMLLEVEECIRRRFMKISNISHALFMLTNMNLGYIFTLYCLAYY